MLVAAPLPQEGFSSYALITPSSVEKKRVFVKHNRLPGRGGADLHRPVRRWGLPASGLQAPHRMQNLARILEGAVLAQLELE